MLINHALINEDKETFATIILQVSLKENWQNGKSDLLNEMLMKKLGESIENHLLVAYDRSCNMLVEEFKAKLSLKTVKFLDRAEECKTVEEFVSIVHEVLEDDYDGLDPVKIERTLTPALEHRINNCGSTLCRILEDHDSDPSYDLGILGEHRKD